MAGRLVTTVHAYDAVIIGAGAVLADSRMRAAVGAL
jgi:2-keto-3-deoxy-6-phosphogluconate aldolase